jgi:tRNA/tmRNA/rRNA uracil-C5-methylase (TrmA/RlmC/RlmD family)
MAELRPGDRVEAVIERVVPGGEGLARLSGVVALVPGGLPGDRVRLRVTDVSDRLVRGAPMPRSVPAHAMRLAAGAIGRPRASSTTGS